MQQSMPHGVCSSYPVITCRYRIFISVITFVCFAIMKIITFSYDEIFNNFNY